MYYIIIGEIRDSDYDFVTANQTLRLIDTSEGRRFAENDIFYVCSDNGDMDKVTGSVINEGLDILGIEEFSNYNKFTGVGAVYRLNIQNTTLGIYFDNSVLLVAYSGYVYKVTNVDLIKYINLVDNCLIITMVGFEGIYSMHIRSSGLIIDAYTKDIIARGRIKFVAEYSDKEAGIALCKNII